jgi:hypothetical protein
MKPLFLVIGWLLLLVLCWPLALLALVLMPIAWAISIPFRLLGYTFSVVFSLLRMLIMLPVRVLGYGRHSHRGTRSVPS